MRYPVWDSLLELKVQIILENQQEEPDSVWYHLLDDAISATEPGSKWNRYLHLYSERIDEFYLDDTVRTGKSVMRQSRKR